MTVAFKNCIKLRDNAFRSGDADAYKCLRNKVNRLRKSLQKRYCNERVQQLKQHNPSRSWNEIKLLCGLRQKSCVTFENICFEGTDVEASKLPDVINNYLVSVVRGVNALDPEFLTKFRNELPERPDALIVSEMSIYYALKKLKTTKASLSDDVTNRLLSVLADVLAGPICALVNSSIRQGIVPQQWKISRITAIPKTTPARHIEKDIRPISITCPIAKVAESFISQFFNEHFGAFLDENQFGSTRNRSTTLALIKFANFLFESSDDCMNFVRVLFIDFSKAFDTIDHTVLCKKLTDGKFPPHIVAWSLSFLQDRFQYVKVGNLLSSPCVVNAGAPQGTRAGPDDFRLIINDLLFSLPCVKYVDDVTVASVSRDSSDNRLQEAVDYLMHWCTDNGMRLNIAKTKEMIVHFGRREPSNAVPMLSIRASNVERVTTFKLLGVFFSSDLSWSAHISYILKKSAKRLYVVYQLVRAGINTRDIVSVYCSLIRSILEYACPVWHAGLTVAQSNDLESVQKRVLRIIFPGLSYNEALVFSGLERLCMRRERLVRKLFNEMKCNDHILNKLLPLRDPDAAKLNVRGFYPYRLPIAKTNRYASSFIPYCIRKRF